MSYMIFEMRTGYVDGVYTNYDNALNLFQGMMVNYPDGVWVMAEVVASYNAEPVMVYSRNYYLNKLSALSEYKDK